MTSSKPYLIRALYEWICDNELTPHVVVDAGGEGVNVPSNAIRDGKVVLNVAPRAVSGLTLGDAQIDFRARFGGQSVPIKVPIPAVLAIYARENGQGMMFPAEQDGEPPPDPIGDESDKPRLRVVK